MEVRRLAGWTAFPATVILLLSACTSGNNGASASKGPDGVVRIGITEPRTLLPSGTVETSGSQVLDALFTPLVDYDTQNKPRMAAAESIASTDNVTWLIKLKDGYTFHNGEKVTADSYIDAWNYVAYGPNAQNNNYFFSRIDGYAALNPADPDGNNGPKTAPTPATKTLSGLKKVNDLAFAVRLSLPFSGFPAALGAPAFYPLPKAAFVSAGVLNKDFGQDPIGDGPFKMKGTWQHNSKIEVERYDAYPGEQPKIRGVQFTIYQKTSTEYAELLAGNEDVMRTIPTEALATAAHDLGDRLQRSPTSALHFLAFPTFQPEFASADVRRAISMAIDRDAINKSVFKDSQLSAHSFVPPVVAGYRDNTCGAACQFDPAQAKQLYAAAKGPATLTITYNDDGGHKEWVDATCAQLTANLGVKCAPVAQPKFADLLTRVADKQPVGMFRMRWIMDYPSMEDYLDSLYSTTGSSNYYGYSNPRVDELVKEGNQAANPDLAVQKYQQAEDILAQDMPVIPLRFEQDNFGHSARVTNVSLDQYDRVDLTKIAISS